MHVSHFVANGVLQTAYWSIGEAHERKTPFILVHGFTGSKLDFQDQLAWFSSNRRVVAYDQRGHGETTNATPYDFYSLVNDFFGLIDALNIKKAHVLGHSMGGMVVMRAALAQPQRFESIILMDTAPGPAGLFGQDVRLQLAELVAEHGCAALLDGMQNGRQPAHMRRGMEHLGHKEHWRRIRVKLQQMDPLAFTELADLMAAHPSVLSSLANLETPTTVIVGAKDKPFLKSSKAMAATLPNAKLVKIARAGHSPQYENTEPWREAVDTHLAGVIS
jgi:3-oxoadipate enol-lactonase